MQHFRLGKRRLSGDCVRMSQYLKEGCKGETRLFTVVSLGGQETMGTGKKKTQKHKQKTIRHSS